LLQDLRPAGRQNLLRSLEANGATSLYLRKSASICGWVFLVFIRVNSCPFAVGLYRLSLSQISLDHFRVAPDFIWWAFRDLNAIIQNVDPFADPHHYPHIVLDQ
jgi:hypothetical protein